MNNKLTKLEAIRGFAAVYVVLHHTFPGIIFLRFGQEAVILFFLLSGFVIRYAYNKSADKSFKTFFLKRFYRIYIPLTLVFITNYLLVASTIDWPTLLGNILMLQDTPFLKPNVLFPPFMGNLPLWSLSYEWWFYMIFFVLKDKPSMIVYITGIVSALTYLIYSNFINRELMYLVIWWTGADMAILYMKNQEISVRSLKLPIVSLAIISVILVINLKLHHITTIGVSPFLELRHFSFSLLTIFAALLWKNLKWRGFNQTFGLFEPVAKISFVLYISHWFLISNAHYLPMINPYLRTAIYMVICILFSYLIERIIYTKLIKYLIKSSMPSTKAALITQK